MRVIENKHFDQGRCTTYLQGECSYRRAEEKEEEEAFEHLSPWTHNFRAMPQIPTFNNLFRK